MTRGRSTGRLRMPTAWGVIAVEASGGRITACRLPVVPSSPPAPSPAVCRPMVLDGELAANRRVLEKAGYFLQILASGHWTPPPPWRLPDGTPFQQKIWRAIAAVPLGTTATYGELARYVDLPRHARALAQACGANPLPLWIPCHRIVAAQGLGGFSAGQAWKAWLLAAEKNGRPYRRCCR